MIDNETDAHDLLEHIGEKIRRAYGAEQDAAQVHLDKSIMILDAWQGQDMDTLVDFGVITARQAKDVEKALEILDS